MKYTKEEILQFAEEENVEFIRLQFTDVFGNLKNMAITASQLERALNNEVMFDGSTIDGFERLGESDMYLYHTALETAERKGRTYALRCVYGGPQAFRGRSQTRAEACRGESRGNGLYLPCGTGV